MCYVIFEWPLTDDCRCQITFVTTRASRVTLARIPEVIKVADSELLLLKLQSAYPKWLQARTNFRKGIQIIFWHWKIPPPPSSLKVFVIWEENRSCCLLYVEALGVGTSRKCFFFSYILKVVSTQLALQAFWLQLWLVRCFLSKGRSSKLLPLPAEECALHTLISWDQW